MEPSPTKERISRLEITLENLDRIDNPNVKRVALSARDVKAEMKKNPDYNLRTGYSEAYSGESS